MFKKILCAVDGSTHSLKAAELASDLAAKHGGALTFLTVSKELKMTDQLKQYIEIENLAGEPQYVLDEYTEDVMQRAKDAARAAGVEKFDVQIKTGPPARTIVHVAEKGHYDALVMGSRGQGDPEAFMLGSVSHKVSNLSRCTVICVK